MNLGVRNRDSLRPSVICAVFDTLVIREEGKTRDVYRIPLAWRNDNSGLYANKS